MANEEIGFLERLTGSPVDERKILEAQRAEAMADTRRRTQAMSARGAQSIAQSIAGLFGKGQQVEDAYTAQAAGISPGELATRRRIRREVASVEDQNSFEGRRKMAQMAAKIANEDGDSASLGRALQALQAVNQEETEWQKLQADTQTSQAKALEAGMATGFDADGPVTGVLARGPNGEGGMKISSNGEVVFRPFGDGFTLYDPKSSGVDMTSPGWLAAELKKNTGVGQVSKMRNMMSSANQSLGRTDRVVGTLQDLAAKGGVESVIGTSGRVITSVDNLSRNIQGLINVFNDAEPGLTEDGSTRSWGGVEGLKAMGRDSTNWLSQLIQLPEGVAATSAAAQQHRASVMEMAYMAARLAEPSNRGLSDNDIKNALVRIAGDTSNPQVMMRRFLEMQLDAYNDLEAELDIFRGSMGPMVTDEAIETALLGRAYERYKKRKDSLFAKFGAVPNEEGRMVFMDDEAMGTDVQPGEGTLQNPPQRQQDAAPAESPVNPMDTSNMTDEEFLQELRRRRAARGAN